MMKRLICYFFLSILLPGIVWAQLEGQGRIQKIKCPDDTTQQYALYVPGNYVPGKKNALLIFMDPSARGDLPVDIYRSLADEYNIIMAGSFNSQNFNGQSSVASFVAVYNDITRLYSIDPNRIWLAGFSGAARAAAAIAMSYPEIKAVIGCGAGFANDGEIKTGNLKAYASLVGERDMNYSELMENSLYLDEQKINNILLTFNGDHEWPPPHRFGLAIEWLINTVNNPGHLPTGRGSFFFETVYHKLDSGYLYAAWMDAQQLGKIPAYKKTADSLLTAIESRKQFAFDKETFRTVAAEEINCMNNFSLAFSRVIDQNESVEKNNWIQKAKLIETMKNNRNHYRQMAAVRCYDHSIRSCQEYYFRFLEEKNYELAYNTARILSFITPKDPDPFYWMAGSRALSGDKKNCKSLLEEAVKRGLVYSNRVIRDSALLKVLTPEEVAKIFDKN